jgi:F0F1-type ATP synthase gamma subunit
LLGLSFHFLKAVHPIAARPTTEATTMITMSAVLLRPEDDEEDVSAAELAEDEAEAVLETVVTARAEVEVRVMVTGAEVAEEAAREMEEAMEAAAEDEDETSGALEEVALATTRQAGSKMRNCFGVQEGVTTTAEEGWVELELGSAACRCQ